jgi:hypothetical protein
MSADQPSDSSPELAAYGPRAFAMDRSPQNPMNCYDSCAEEGSSTPEDMSAGEEGDEMIEEE